ncbi:MAG TPA: hypothetical protein VEM32_11570 [Geobacteraceae bacterium]|nr:hypothetical protein [Geobacteraceae bacterium]
MKMKVACGLILTFLLMAIFGCGGGGDATPPVVVAVTQSATTANTNNNNTVNTSVTITATVTVNGKALPDGTIVAFTVKSGIGTLSAPSAATVTGDASVTLTSATDGASVVVSASSGGAFDDSAAVTFTDPNRPTGVTVTASPTTGVVPGTPVAISASITRLGGNGVPAGPVPDGTTVSFAVTSGTGTLSAASALTTGGIATVNLSSTTTNASVIVTALAGLVAKTVTVPFIAQPTLAIVKVQTSGLPAGQTIANITASVTYSTNKGLSITANNVVASGAGTGAGLAANVNTPGQVGITLTGITLNTPSGILDGEFATLTFSIAPGNVPTASDFGIAPGVLVTDDLGAQLPSVTVTIMSVTVQ